MAFPEKYTKELELKKKSIIMLELCPFPGKL